MFNLLAITKLGEGLKNVNLDWLGKVIRAIIENPGYSVGVGIIFFTLILKLITLPFDIISRVSSKKNSIKMEKMRPELERLQRQYAKNKNLYQQKVMALQKKSGYSPLASCLPSIISIVIFFVVIGKFNDYSKYANNSLFRKMTTSYNKVLDEKVEDGFLKLSDTSDTVYYLNTDNEDYIREFNESDIGLIAEKSGEIYILKESTEKYDNLYKLLSDGLKNKYNVFIIEEEKAVGIDTSKIQGKTEEQVLNEIIVSLVDDFDEDFTQKYVLKDAQEASKNTFNKEKDSFLWIKNIWEPDTSFKHPLGGFSSLKDSLGKNFKDDYYELTAQMSGEKKQANGYFILIVLSIGSMLLSQIISGKDQKTQVDLGSVEGKDGTMGQTQKMMKFVLPIMFGIFAFIYTSAFSIYMIVSSLFSTLSTVLISLIVESIFKKKEKEENKDKRFGIKK